MSRDLEKEIDALTEQVAGLQQMVQHFFAGKKENPLTERSPILNPTEEFEAEEAGAVYFSGFYRNGRSGTRWELKQKDVSHLLELNGEKLAKVLSALAHKQRLDILRAVMQKPLTGPELVERLNMGTTGQLYHHIKALAAADLLAQEERGGRYTLPARRMLPMQLLLAAGSNLLDSSSYIGMEEARNQANLYLGTETNGGYDIHVLLWAVLENSILEHRAGHCTEVSLYLHEDGSVTVSDNGRGIPVKALPGYQISNVQSILTDIEWLSNTPVFVAPGAEKGISIAVANALSRSLSLEIRRDGRIFRQDYKKGIPQTGLITVGATQETGTSVTFLADPDLFKNTFDDNELERKVAEISSNYSGLRLSLYKNA